MADDLRPDLGCYANAHAGFISPVGTENTPNIDKLAADSILFEKAFVQQALCSPSRTSLLTSRRPDTTRVTDITNYFRDIGGNFTTIPQFFKELGYNSIGMGKIFHSGEASGGDNDGYSWTDPDSYTAGRNYYRCGCDTCSHVSNLLTNLKERFLNFFTIRISFYLYIYSLIITGSSKSGNLSIFLCINRR